MPCAFESDLKSPASEVYLHEMPGGQFTNLKEQARSIGLESRWHEVAQAYSDVNELFGDIVKVTPSSKVVGDMALMMVSQDLSVDDVMDTSKEVAFPTSVVSLMKGELSQPAGGWPSAVQKRILKDEEPITNRAGELLPQTNLDLDKKQIEEELGEDISNFQYASYLMYPKVFRDFFTIQNEYGPTSQLPTPVYFYGLKTGDEIFVELERGKTLVVRCLAFSETNDKGMVRVFFELNGQPRSIAVPDRAHGAAGTQARAKADINNACHVGSPLPGVISAINIETGTAVKHGDVLLSIEAMKMETALYAEHDGIVAKVHVAIDDQVDAKDLLAEFEAVE